jgi:hypothetical protein
VIPPRLEDDPDAGPPLLGRVDRIDTEHGNVARRSRPEALEDLDRRGFPGSVRTEERDDLSPSDGETDLVEDVDRPVAHPETLDPDHGLGLGHPASLVP